MLEMESVQDKDCGWTKLWYAIIQQAVEDVKYLQEIGVLRGGEMTGYWPKNKKGENSNILTGIRKQYDIDRLIHFFRSGVAYAMLEEVGSIIDRDALLEGMGL